MKKLASVILMLTATVSFAQLKKVELPKGEPAEEIGKIQPLGQPVHMDCYKKGNTYTFTYKDGDYQQLTEYREFSFENNENEFETFYQMIMDGFEEKPTEPVMLEFKNHFVWLNYEKSMGMTLLRFSSSTDKSGTPVITRSNMFSKKQIVKLFGKKK